MDDASYRNYRQWKQWTPAEFGAFSRADRAYFFKELRAAGFNDLAGVRMVEIGFGNGGFAAWALSRGARYSGVEVQQELVDAARRMDIDAHLAGRKLVELFGSGVADLVLGFDVFEHMDVEQIRDVFTQCKQVLRSGAILLGRVPSGDSPFARAIQYGDLTHRSVLGSSAIHQLGQGAGLEVVAIRSPAFPLGGMGPVTFLRRSMVQLVGSIVRTAIAVSLMGGGGPVLTPNLVFVLRKP